MKAVGFVTLMVALLVFRAFTIAKFWAWYVAAPFHLHVLGMWEAYGLALFASLFSHTNDSELKDKTMGENLTRAVAISTLPWVAAGILNLLK